MEEIKGGQRGKGVELLRREPAAAAAAVGGVKYLGRPELGAQAKGLSWEVQAKEG